MWQFCVAFVLPKDFSSLAVVTISQSYASSHEDGQAELDWALIMSGSLSLRFCSILCIVLSSFLNGRFRNGGDLTEGLLGAQCKNVSSFEGRADQSVESLYD